MKQNPNPNQQKTQPLLSHNALLLVVWVVFDLWTTMISNY